MTSIDWGTAPAWAAAVFTSSGVAWGAWTFRLSRHDRIREHAERILFKREQMEPRRNENGMRYRASVRNVSALPFLAVSVDFAEFGDRDTVVLSSLEPDDEEVVESKVMEVRLPYKRKIWWQHPLRRETHLEITDLGGYHWWRSLSGETVPAPRQALGPRFHAGAVHRFARWPYRIYRLLLPSHVRNTAEELWVWRPWRGPTRNIR